MAAYLVRNHADGTPIAYPGLTGLPELLPCGVPCGALGCDVSYTLACGQVEKHIEGNFELIRSKATELVKRNHPHPVPDDAYEWNHIAREWMKAERAQAKARGGQ